MPLLTRPAVRRRDRVATLTAAVTPSRLALGRTGAGAVMVVRPRLLAQVLGVDSASAARTAWLAQMLGAREVALGLGTLVALRSGPAPSGRTWIAAGALCDAADVLAVGAAVARGRLSRPVGAAVVVSALGAALGGLAALRAQDAPG